MRKVYNETKTIDDITINVQAWAPYSKSESPEPPDMPGMIMHQTSPSNSGVCHKYWALIEPEQGCLTHDADIQREAIKQMDLLINMVKA